MGNLIFNQTIHCEVSVLANTPFKYTQVCGLVNKQQCKGEEHSRKP